MLVLGFAATPASAANFDALGGETLGDTPYSSVAPFDGSVSYDATDFTTTSDERTHAGSVLACGSWGSKTGWVRLATAVTGNLRVTVDTTFDVIYHVFRVPLTIAPGAATAADLIDVDCIDARTIGGEDYVFGYAIPAGQTIYVQTAAKCAASGGPAYPCSAMQESDALSGLTSVRLRFTAANQDGDNVPDTLDGCPAQAGAIGGCPDSDGDGVADVADSCPTQIGHAANGCRLPDEDHDGYRVDGASASTRDCNDDAPGIHPGAREILGNDIDEDCDGRAAFDRDADGVVDTPAGPDCDPAKPAVHPGAVDLRGNDLDEDCSGSAAPYLRVDSRVSVQYGQYRDGVLRPLSFTVLDVVAGMRIEVNCSGRGCIAPIVRKVRKAASKLRVATSLARARKLAVGARLTVRITQADRIGRVIRYTVRSRRRKARIKIGCLQVGSTTKELPAC